MGGYDLLNILTCSLKKLIVEVTVDLMLPSNRSHGSLYTTVKQTSSEGTGSLMTILELDKTYIDTYTLTNMCMGIST